MQQCTAYHLRIVSTCRPAGAKCGNAPKLQGASPIVGAWFPSPTGWVTQPLRVQASPSFFSPPLRSLRRCVLALKFLPVSRYHMSPLWGFGYLVCRVFYKHAAPLGLNAAQFAVRHHRRGLVSKPDGLGNPTPTDSSVPFLLFPSAAFFASLRRCVKVSSRIPLSHVAPLGLNASLSPSPFLPFLLLPPPRPLRLCVESYHVSRVTFHFP